MPYVHIGLIFCVLYGLTLQPELYWYFVWFCMHFIIITFGIHFTFHRLFSHKSFQTTKFIECIGTLFGCLAMSGSSIGWSGVHIQHHRYSDTIKDPHPRSRGWKLALGFIDHSIVKKRSFLPIAHLTKDPFHSIVHKYQVYIVFVWWILCYIMFGIEGLFFLGLMPSSTAGLATQVSNMFIHKNDEPVNLSLIHI